MIYTDSFTGANVYPSEISYSAVALSADITLSWPEEASTGANLATRIMDVTPSAAGLVITLPYASRSGTGNTILFANRGAYSFAVKDSSGAAVLASVTTGTLWQVYLTDNSTDAGEWNTLQYGATTSVANAADLAGTGIVAVGALLSQSVPVTTGFASGYAPGSSDRAKMFVWSSTGAGAMALVAPSTVGNNWFIYIRNGGGGALTLTPVSGLINGGSALTFQPGDSSIVACDGTNYYTIGYGQSAVFAFYYTSINIGSGSGDYTLSTVEQNKIAYKFTGSPSVARNIIVPNTMQQYWVNNATGVTLTIKTASVAGISLGAGVRAILYCDGGGNLIDASSAGVSLPLSLTNGGTGFIASSTGDLLTKLGGTSLGTTLFTASSTAVVWGALGTLPSGSVDGGTF